MADISKYLKKIRTAIYGREVRSSIADGIEAVNNAQETLDQKFDDQIANMTPPNNPSLAEVVDARTSGVTGNKYVTLGKRLDSGEIESRTYTDEKISELVLGEVRSVNGKTGDVILMAKHVGAPSINDLRVYALKGEPAGQYTPTFLNGWYVQAGEVKGVCYYKDQFGYVHLYGTCSGTKTEFGTPLFNLPAGFRPSGVIRVGCLMINFADYSRSIQFLGVYPSGEVLVESYGLPGFVSFSIFPSTFYGQR